jgi:hypothetical protein
MTRVERLWPGETVAILGCGPSLTPVDVEHVRGKARVIAINAAIGLAPWADSLYCADARYWAHVKGAPAFQGLKYSLEAASAKWPGVQVLRNCGTQGLELDPTGLKSGGNSGYQAINLAVHLGAARVLLLGYDMGPHRGRDHFTPDYPWAPPNYRLFLRHFPSIVQPLKEAGVEVVNCTRGSALKCFPYQSLADALTAQAVAS